LLSELHKFASAVWAQASTPTGAGFALLATFDHPHFTLVLADLSELTLARLDRCFDDPIPNPGRSTQG
jgi:hypothetical protein